MQQQLFRIGNHVFKWHEIIDTVNKDLLYCPWQHLRWHKKTQQCGISKFGFLVCDTSLKSENLLYDQFYLHTPQTCKIRRGSIIQSLVFKGKDQNSNFNMTSPLVFDTASLYIHTPLTGVVQDIHQTDLYTQLEKQGPLFQIDPSDLAKEQQFLFDGKTYQKHCMRIINRE